MILEKGDRIKYEGKNCLVESASREEVVLRNLDYKSDNNEDWFKLKVRLEEVDKTSLDK